MGRIGDGSPPMSFASALTCHLPAFVEGDKGQGDILLSAPECLVAGGETTVTVRGTGKGGRNTELALAAAIGLDGVRGTLLVSLATDGEDGPTDAAGAVANGETFGRAAGLGLDASGYLDRNDSFSYFARLGDLIKTGPSGTNVNDLVFLFKF